MRCRTLDDMAVEAFDERKNGKALAEIITSHREDTMSATSDEAKNLQSCMDDIIKAGYEASTKQEARDGGRKVIYGNGYPPNKLVPLYY